MEKNFLLRSGQLYPSLGSLYKYNLGISSLLRERIARFMNADEESASEMDNNHIINNLLYGDHGGPEESLVAELFANESYGTAFEFHESREDLDRILNGDPEKRFRRPLSVYDLGENCWGMVSERKEELALRDELEKTLDSSRKVELWQKIRELNKKANFLEEALLEENPSKRQRQMKDDARPMLLQNLIEYMHSGSHFYAFEALPRISIKGGHPHKALIQQHFLEEKIKSLNNSAYELIPLKKYLGTSASFMSEWIDEAKWVPISICKYELTYACKSLECRLPETFGVLPLKSDHNEYAEFEVDEKILGLIPKAVGLIRKIQNDTELSSDEEIIIRNYAQIQIADLDSQFKQLSDLHIKYSQDESKTEETRKMWRDSVTRLTREYQTERNNLLNTDYAKKASLKRLQKDIETLVSVKGFAMLYKDLDNMNDEAISEISREGVSAPGSIMIDLHDLNHIIYRGIGPSGKPAFTIIDQYHLGAGELEHKRRVHGDTRPHIGLRMGP